MKKNWIRILTFVFVLALVSCSKEPATEMTAAKAAVELAAGNGADRYASETFQAAQDTFKLAMEEMEIQKGKFSLFRNYDKTAELLVSATSLAEQAQAETEEMKIQVREQVVNLVSEVKTIIADTKTNISNAPAGKEGTAALEAITIENDELENSLIALADQIETNDDPLKLLDKVKQMQIKSNSLNLEIRTVIEKYSKKNPAVKKAKK